MEASRELDAVVEYEIFRKPNGWTKDWADRLSPLMRNLMIPNFSTDIAEACKILVAVRSWIPEKRVDFINELLRELQVGFDQPVGIGEAILYLEPLAICRAALNAIGLTKQS